MTRLAFSYSGLDRAAHLRRDSAELLELAAQTPCVLAMWRGKPLLGADDGLLWLSVTDPVIAGVKNLAFLGLSDGQPRFAADMSAWDPDGDLQTGAFLDPTIQTHPNAPKGSGFHDMRAAMPLLSAPESELAAVARSLLGWHESHRFCAKCGTESDWDEAGWSRNCPACGTRHFPRTDPVVIVLVTHGNDVLVGRSPEWPEGMYSLLAGFVEPGETLEAAAAREVAEEAGITLGPVTYLAAQPWPFPSSLMFGMRAEAVSRDITLDPEELDDARWVSREDMLSAINGQHPTLRPARQGAIARYLIEEWLAGRIA